jgi:hypothetical protein
MGLRADLRDWLGVIWHDWVARMSGLVGVVAWALSVFVPNLPARPRVLGRRGVEPDAGLVPRLASRALRPPAAALKGRPGRERRAAAVLATSIRARYEPARLRPLRAAAAGDGGKRRRLALFRVVELNGIEPSAS